MASSKLLAFSVLARTGFSSSTTSALDLFTVIGDDRTGSFVISAVVDFSIMGVASFLSTSGTMTGVMDGSTEGAAGGRTGADGGAIGFDSEGAILDTIETVFSTIVCESITGDAVNLAFGDFIMDFDGT